MRAGVQELGAESPPAAGERARAQVSPARSATVVLLATAAADSGGPAAALPWEGTTLLGRLLGQLAGLGACAAHVVTRPGWEEALRDSLRAGALEAELHVCARVPDDLRTVAAIARGHDGTTVVAYGDLVTHREALAGLLADPRIPTGVLSSKKVGRPYTLRLLASRGRVLSASSPYHSVHHSTGGFLGVLKVGAGDAAVLAQQAERLARLTDPPEQPWRAELDGKSRRWRRWLARRTVPSGRRKALTRAELESLPLPPDLQADLELRAAALADDVVALLLVGLVRAGADVGNSHLRQLFWARPLSRAAAEEAQGSIQRYDEDSVLLDSAVKKDDGFFTTFFVSPYTKYVARWAARRGISPNQITVLSLLIGLGAAAAFAVGGRAAAICGAVLLQVAFSTDCVDGQLARYTRRFSSLGAWLDATFDRSKEWAVFAGLAIGAAREGTDVWLLAGCALLLQATRHAADFSYRLGQREEVSAAVRQEPLESAHDRPRTARAAAAATAPSAARTRPTPRARRPVPPARRRPAAGRLVLDRLARSRLGLWWGRLAAWWETEPWREIPWVSRIVAFPIGERFAVISITAAAFSPHTTFLVLLIWGAVAICHVVGGRALGYDP